jgi:hypothetical protein
MRKFAYIRLNIQTPCLPRLAVPLLALGKNVGSDGNLWVALPDNSAQDVNLFAPGVQHYDAWATPTKYHPYIGLTTSSTNVSLDDATPEVCVGQTVTMGMDWLGGNPPFTNVDSVWWHLPDKYVNQQTNYSSTCTTYVKNTDLLTNTAIQCWYVNGSGGNCSVRETLHFSNGQSVTIAAAGSFTVYRPGVNQPVTFGPYNAALEGSYPPMLELADNAMYYTVTINSKYSGSFGLTQLVKMYSETVLIPPDGLTGATTWGNFNLDINPDGSTGEYYDGPNDISHSCRINDPPGQPLWFFIGDYTGNWQDYVRFTPGGSGSIPVTLGRIDWNWAAAAENPGTGWYITSDGEDGPTPHPDDSFPLWKSEGITQFPIP